MSLSFSDESFQRFRSVVANSSALFGGRSIQDVESFIIDAYALQDDTLCKERTVHFHADRLETCHKLGQGCFHVAFKGTDVDGFVWVIKKPLRTEELKEIVPDFLKQNIAHELSTAFTAKCKETYQEEVFLLYNKPYIATVSFKFKSGEIAFMDDAFFEMESFLPGEFEYFNRPNGQLNVERSGKLGPNRLPQIFSQYTHDVTGGSVLVSDVQGCKLARGQYWCTDPILFTKSGSFGIVDHGVGGMSNFLSCIQRAVNASDALKCVSNHLKSSKSLALTGRVETIISLGNKTLCDKHVPKQVTMLMKDRPTLGCIVQVLSQKRWGRIVKDDHDASPYKVCFSDGEMSSWLGPSMIEPGRGKQRATLSDRVRVKASGKIGKIIQDDHDGAPYKVGFDDSTTSGYLCESDLVLDWRPVIGDRVVVGSKTGKISIDDGSGVPFKVEYDGGETVWKVVSSVALVWRPLDSTF